MAYSVGIDLGGTKLLAGVIDVDTGEVLSTALHPTREQHAPDSIAQRLVAVTEEAVEHSHIHYHDVATIGIGVAGQIDSERGVIVHAPNLPIGLAGVPIAESLHDLLNRPVRLVNDVVAAAAGEAAFGAGRGYGDFVCVFVGTGIGGAVYDGGRLHRGATGTAGEIGHTVVDMGGRLCSCGGKGHLEAYSSRTAIVRSVLSGLRLGRESSLARIEPSPDPDAPRTSRVGHRELADAVRAGDALACEAVQEAARYMAAGLVSIMNFYNPARIVLGGGVAGGIDTFFDQSAELARNGALEVPARGVEIVPALMGEYSGIVGAALLSAEDV